MTKDERSLAERKVEIFIGVYIVDFTAAAMGVKQGMWIAESAKFAGDATGQHTLGALIQVSRLHIVQLVSHWPCLPHRQ
jgi:hypothetical protein